MSHFIKVASVAGALSLLLTSQSAATPLVNFTDTVSVFSGGGYTLGYRFTVGASSQIVSALGAWDFMGDGFLESHIVGLWAADGTLLASTPVNSSDPLDLVGQLGSGFRYAAITPTVLVAGDYLVGVSDYFADAWGFNANGYSILPGFTFVSSGYAVGPGLLFPGSVDNGAPNGFFGPNLQIGLAGAPELNATDSGLPLTFAFLGLLAAQQRRNHRNA